MSSNCCQGKIIAKMCKKCKKKAYRIRRENEIKKRNLYERERRPYCSAPSKSDGGDIMDRSPVCLERQRTPYCSAPSKKNGDDKKDEPGFVYKETLRREITMDGHTFIEKTTRTYKGPRFPTSSPAGGSASKSTSHSINKFAIVDHGSRLDGEDNKCLALALAGELQPLLPARKSKEEIAREIKDLAKVPYNSQIEMSHDLAQKIGRMYGIRVCIRVFRIFPFQKVCKFHTAVSTSKTFDDYNYIINIGHHGASDGSSGHFVGLNLLENSTIPMIEYKKSKGPIITEVDDEVSLEDLMASEC